VRSLPKKPIAGCGCLLLMAALTGCGGSSGGHTATTSAKVDPPGAAGASGSGASVAKADPTGGRTDPAGATKADPAGTKSGAAGGEKSKTGASAGAGGVKTATVTTPHGRVEVAEIRDPEEAKSFPLPASTQHRSASTPSVAGETAVAAGAPSDAEIKRELNEMHAVERAAAQTQRRELTPVAGGESVGGNGTIPIPSGVPEAVQRVIAGGNAIADFPYIWGGGHASFVANGYDCSGSVSYALAAGGLLSAPLVSGDLASWGEPGPGRWITIYANAGHTFMDVDGMWFDTAGRSGPYASRWLVATPPLEGYAVRHPPGL
jgi:cell wall-associated NlpC family hydrolase